MADSKVTKELEQKKQAEIKNDEIDDKDLEKASGGIVRY